MLDINVAMGFRPYRTFVVHQAATAELTLGPVPVALIR